MTSPDAISRQIERVIDRLEKERDLLLSGNLKGLDRLTADLSRELDKLEAMDGIDHGHQALLQKLNDMAARNLAVAAGSKRGLMTVRRLLKESVDGAPDLKTYSPDGGTQVLSNARHQRDHRT